MPTDVSPEIAGLNRFDATGSPVLFAGDGSTADNDEFGTTYSCDGGIGFPDVTCLNEGPSSYSLARTLQRHTEWFPGAGVFADDLYPAPDLALVVAEVNLNLFPYSLACLSDPGQPGGFGCADYHGDEAAVTLDFVTPGGTGTPNFVDPVPGWTTDTWNPGRDPAYTPGGDWVQQGVAIVSPPAPIYTDPDPLDPNIDYAPHLWRWRDVIGAEMTLNADATGDGWGRVFAEAGGFRWFVTLYSYVTPPPHSGETIFWL